MFIFSNSLLKLAVFLKIMHLFLVGSIKGKSWKHWEQPGPEGIQEWAEHREKYRVAATNKIWRLRLCTWCKKESRQLKNSLALRSGCQIQFIVDKPWFLLHNFISCLIVKVCNLNVVMQSHLQNNAIWLRNLEVGEVSRDHWHGALWESRINIGWRAGLHHKGAKSKW